MISKDHLRKKKQTKDQLHMLIRTMSKSEKRAFKIYAQRTKPQDQAKFIRLFDVLEKQQVYNSEQILKKLHPIKKSQLSNIKQHLYQQILKSLRLIHSYNSLEMQIREQIDYANILYDRGLYMQALKLLNRVKLISRNTHQDILHYEILAFKKIIEEKHITRSRRIDNAIDHLLDESSNQIQVLQNACELSNLKIKIHGLYIKFGHARNENEGKKVKEYFEDHLPLLDYNSLTFFERVFWHQSYVWCYFILLDFKACRDAAKNWVKIFWDSPEMINMDTDLYMRGLHYVISSAYNLQDTETVDQYVGAFERLRREIPQMNATSEMIFFLYYYSARMEQHFLKGSFEDGLEILSDLEIQLKKFGPLLDIHRVMVFNYRMAWMCFGAADYSKAIDYLNKIIQLKAGHLREDVQCYARLLHLICHLELNNYQLLQYLEPNTYSFIQKMKERNDVQNEIMLFVRKTIKNPSLKMDYLLDLKTALLPLDKDRFARRGLVYINLLPWIESKIKNKSMELIVKQSIS